ncbi:MAG TPA: aminoglycoside phosphotransferase family protein [Thermoleophilaceae bacterium]|nr:aminoglycoside phosphotransferase family protein [Thermoleophilaceae bacterium]
MPVDLEQALRTAVESGDWPAAGPLLAPDVALHSSSPRGVVHRHGRDDVVAHLGVPGPGTVPHWEAREWPPGLAITFEWHGADSRDRRRWYVRRHDAGLVRDIWSYAARPSEDGGAPAGVPDAVLAAVEAEGGPEPLTHGGNSGAALMRLRGARGQDLVVKRTAPGEDWLARVTGDRGRVRSLWDHGAFAAMPASIDSGIAAVVAEDDADWVVMRDVSAHLLDAERTLGRDEARRVLAAAAQMHQTFSGDPLPGAATLEARLGMSSPRVADAERDSPDLLPKQIELAWEAFADVCPDDLAEPVLRLARDPAPLAGALLTAAPATLLHGDLRDDNLGFDGDRVVLIDWDLATAGTPTVEFAWFLLQDAWRIDASRDDIEADYRAAEAELDADEVELGMLSGLVQYGWLLGHSARVHPDPEETRWAGEELGWWVPRVRRALEHLGSAPGV